MAYSRNLLFLSLCLVVAACFLDCAAGARTAESSTSTILPTITNVTTLMPSGASLEGPQLTAVALAVAAAVFGFAAL
ncbi:hypothetical protein Efla_007241 [Eimeria flavescens]